LVNCLEFTKKLHFFYNEDSFLWKNLIGEKIKENLDEEEYRKIMDRITGEIDDIEKLNELSWPV
jgi:hypothetical protein